MTPTKQANRHKPDEGVWGDCHRAAIAAVLDLPLNAVPHFFDNGTSAEVGHAAVRAFLAERGIVPIEAVYHGDDLDLILSTIERLNPGLVYLLGGTSRTGCNHTVVCAHGRIVCDPSINDAGIVGPCDDGWYWVTYFGSSQAMIATGAA